VARKRGTLLLVAFLAAVMVSGSGGVTLPFHPPAAESLPATITLTGVIPAPAAPRWRMPRME
jgi:hypothetical protein